MSNQPRLRSNSAAPGPALVDTLANIQVWTSAGYVEYKFAAEGREELARLFAGTQWLGFESGLAFLRTCPKAPAPPFHFISFLFHVRSLIHLCSIDQISFRPLLSCPLQLQANHIAVPCWACEDFSLYLLAQLARKKQAHWFLFMRHVSC